MSTFEDYLEYLRRSETREGEARASVAQLEAEIPGEAEQPREGKEQVQKLYQQYLEIHELKRRALLDRTAEGGWTYPLACAHCGTIRRHPLAGDRPPSYGELRRILETTWDVMRCSECGVRHSRWLDRRMLEEDDFDALRDTGNASGGPTTDDLPAARSPLADALADARRFVEGMDDDDEVFRPLDPMGSLAYGLTEKVAGQRPSRLVLFLEPLVGRSKGALATALRERDRVTLSRGDRSHVGQVRVEGPQGDEVASLSPDWDYHMARVLRGHSGSPSRIRATVRAVLPAVPGERDASVSIELEDPRIKR